MAAATEPPRRAAQNAPGPFYAEQRGCDCGCLLPEAEAPELLATAGRPTFQTYFRRQPETPSEVERACAALLICPVHSLRYGGRDPAVLVRLAEAPYLCDYRITTNGSVVPIDPKHAEPFSMLTDSSNNEAPKTDASSA